MTASRLFSFAYWRAWLVLSGLLVLAACHKTPDEVQIRQVIDVMAAAVESGNVGAMAGHLHSDFRANNGMDANQVRQMMMLAGMQKAALKVTIVSAQTQLDAVYHDRASSTLSVVVTSGTSIAGLPADGSAHVVNLDWRKDGDDWKILRATWNE